MQHITYSEQLVWKGRMVGDALRRIGKLSAEDPLVQASPKELHYRNKISMTLRRLPGGRLVAGFFQRGSRHRILDIGPECQLPNPRLGELWKAFRGGWGAQASRLPQGNQLRLTLREVDGSGALVIQGGKGDGRPLELMEAVPGLNSVWRQDPSGRVRHLAGEEALVLEWLHHRFAVGGGAFLQVNTEGGKELHRFLLETAGEVTGMSIVDAYCGVGVLGREWANRGAEVVGIEAHPQAVEAAAGNAPGTFFVLEGKVEKILPKHLPADLLLLNPPRRGLDPAIPPSVVQAPPERIFYVSCDPATLARDLGRLEESHRLMDLRSFDLFPQTSHVESVAILARRTEAHRWGDASVAKTESG